MPERGSAPHRVTTGRGAEGQRTEHTSISRGAGDGNSGSVVLLEQPRGAEVLRIMISEYKGRQLVDVRAWYRDRDGELRPGRQGISLRPEGLPKVIEALQRAAAEVGADA